MGTTDDWIAHLLVSAFVSLITGGFGSYIGIRMAITRLEEWRSMISPKVDMHETRLGWHGEDIMAHDVELSLALGKLNIDRVSRQSLRRQP